jgi:hypothetical protein
MQSLLALSSSDLTRATEIHLDSWAFVFTLALAVGTGILFGLVPVAAHVIVHQIAGAAAKAAHRESTSARNLETSCPRHIFRVSGRVLFVQGAISHNFPLAMCDELGSR